MFNARHHINVMIDSFNNRKISSTYIFKIDSEKGRNNSPVIMWKQTWIDVITL